MFGSKRIVRGAVVAGAGPEPVRRVVRRNATRVTWRLPSVKMGCLVACESGAERKHALRLEADAAVVRFHTQPEVVTWRKDGAARRHVPDFRVELEDGSVELHEVKPRDALRDLDGMAFEERTIVLREALGARGVRYRVIDDTEFDRQPRLANAMLVWAARRRRPTTRFVQRVVELVRHHGASTLGELTALLPETHQPDFLCLALYRVIAVDLESTPISPATRVRIPRRG